jgi:glycine/D-amino acid oxidase-like deaminating enzyme
VTGPFPRPACRSWWLEEALALPEFAGPPCPPPSGELGVDVVVIGGGYTGMWTAFQLTEREPGVEVAILERDICGGGPSGRNGGFCNGLWEELPLLARTVGDRGALATAAASEESVFAIGGWCERFGVDAWYRASGHVGVSTSPAQDGAWRETLETAERLGAAEGRFVELDEDEIRTRCDSPVFRAGMRTPRTATVQPARLARGLRRVLLERGVRIFEDTPVRRFRGGRGAFEVETPSGRVRARSGVLAAGAYLAASRPFRRTILPRASFIVLTEPVPDRLEELGWTGGEGLYDFRTALRYVRTTRDGRIAFGAASSRAGLGTGMGPRLDFDEVSVAALMRDFARWFPTLTDVRFDCAWGGPIDVTRLHLPFFGTLPGGAVHYGVGFTGGGVGPCHLAGRILSGLALGVDDEHTRLPLVGLRPRPFPPEPLRSIGAAAVHRAIVRGDEAQDDGRTPDPVTSFVARLPRRLGYELGP